MSLVLEQARGFDSVVSVFVQSCCGRAMPRFDEQAALRNFLEQGQRLKEEEAPVWKRCWGNDLTLEGTCRLLEKWEQILQYITYVENADAQSRDHWWDHGFSTGIHFRTRREQLTGVVKGAAEF